MTHSITSSEFTRTARRAIIAIVALCGALLSSGVWAEQKKFVYAYDASGALLKPTNAAAQCPDPDGSSSASSDCRGVAVNADGTYSVHLATKDLSSAKNLLLVACNYEYVAAGSKGATQDTYALIERKRRVDALVNDHINNGANINLASEAVVRALEKKHDIAGSDKGALTKTLASVAGDVDADALNKAMGNARDDNAAGSDEDQHDHALMHINQGKMSADDAEKLSDLAALALDNKDDELIQRLVRKNVTQGALQPSLMTEIHDRVFSHVMGVAGAGTGKTVVVLDAKKYKLGLGDSTDLTTGRTVNPAKIFAYTWDGVVSDTSSAVFKQSTTGSYLVCVSAELTSFNESTSDCVRLLVRQPVEAVAHASAYTVGSGGMLRLSGALSVGAKTYAWSGSGVFSDVAAMDTAWKAPDVPGNYTVTLTVNGEDSDSIHIDVYDVKPVAVAHADKDSVTLSNGNASVTLTSLSTTTDGGSPDAIAWAISKQPNSSAPTLSSTSDSTTVFNTKTAGKYTIELTATKSGHTDTTAVNIQVTEPGKVFANAGKDQTTFRNQSVTLDGSLSSAQSGKPLSYAWSAASGTLTNATSAKAGFKSAVVGTFPVTLSVSDGDSTAADDVSVVVRNRAPVASDDTFKLRPSRTLVGKLRAGDDDGDALTYRIVDEPSNGAVTLDPSTGSFTYVPGVDKSCRLKTDVITIESIAYGGDVPVIKLCADRDVVAVGDTVNLIASASINASKFSGYFWTNNAKADPIDIRRAYFKADHEGTFQVCVTGNVGQSKNISTACVDIIVGDNPGGDITKKQTSYSDRFRFRVNDGIDDSNLATVTLVVSWENSLPVAQNQTITTAEETTVTGTLVASDDDSGDVLSYAISTNGVLGTATITNAATGAFSYTPGKDKFGTDKFTFVANDTHDNSKPATVTITVTNVNDAPVATFTGPLATLEETPVSGTLTATDVDGDALTFKIIAQGTHGTVAIINASTGAFVYTPKKDAFGSDTFYYAASDGTLESAATGVSVTITNVNDPPTAADLGPITVHTDEVATGSLAGNDVDGDALYYAVVTAPTKGTLKVDAATGKYSYTPKGTSYLGSDTFTYKVSDAASSSNVATVALNVLAVNHAPTASAQTINVIEGVVFGGALVGTDPDGTAVTYSVVSNGKLGTAEITDSKTGAFTYTPKTAASGADYFTFKVSDGDKESAPTTVSINIAALSKVCLGPGSALRDADNDGYADFVEQAFSTGVNNAASTPYGLDAKALGVSFIGDADGDGYADNVELWLGSDPRSASSKFSASTLRNVPDCFNPARDSAPPAVYGFHVVTSTLDASTGTAQPKYAFTAVDNASGIQSVTVRLLSPSGIENKALLNVSDAPLVLATQFTGPALNKFAEAGVWNVTEVKIVDNAGQILSLNNQDLKNKGMDNKVTVSNANADSTAPTLTNFEVLTPTLDVSSASAPAQFRLTLSDNRAGIARASVYLRSPSGVFRWGEVTHNSYPTSVVDTISTTPLETFVEPGTWTVAEVDITDQAGNVRKLNSAALTASGFATTVLVTTTVPDTVAPVSMAFSILTPTVDPSPGNATVRYSVSFTDNNSGTSDVVVVLTGPSKQLLLGSYHAGTPSTSLTTQITSEPFARDAQTGTWKVTQLTARDTAGNSATWDEAALKALGYATTVTVQVPGNGAGGGSGAKKNSAPSATSSTLSTNEDTAVSGVMHASDADGDVLNYTVVSYPSNGSLSNIDAAAGTFTYTPKANVNGNDQFSFKVDDGTAESNVATVSITINPVGDPTLVDDMDIKTTMNTVYTGYLNGTDVDGETLTYKIVTNGSLGTATIPTASTPYFQYLPKTGMVGSDQFTFTVNDSNSISRVATVNVTILPVFSITKFEIKTPIISGKDSAPVVSSEITLGNDIATIDKVRVSIKGPHNQLIGFVTAVGGSGAYPVSLSRAVQTVSENLEAGTWKFVNLIASKIGDPASTLIAADLSTLGFADTLTVVGNTSPVATSRSYTTTLDTPVSANLTATDAEGNALTYRITGDPVHGSVTLTNEKTGAFVFTPKQTGGDSFKFVANDGYSDSAETTIYFNVLANNGAPVAFANTIAVTKNQSYAGTLSASDANSDPLTYSVVAQPTLGTVSLIDASTGAFVYYPKNGVTGADSFTFKANDGKVDSNIATVSVTITVTNTAPVASNASITVFQNVSYSGTLPASDADGNALTYTIVSKPSAGALSVTSGTGAFIYTPLLNVTGADRFTFKVSDGSSTSNTATVNVNVLSAEQACGTGGTVSDADTDGDGYSDDVERAFGTNPNSASSTPAGMSAQLLGITFKGDSDKDGVVDYIETWLRTNPNDPASKPDAVMSSCFDSTSDGIKPRVMGFKILTPTINAGAGDTTARIAMTVADNASGVKRVRIGLRSPSGTFATQSISLSDYPVLRGVQMDIATFGAYSEAGVWTVSSVTVYDEAGNRLDLVTSDLNDAGWGTTITVINSNADATAPSLTSLTVLTPSVTPGSGTAVMSVQLGLTDAGSGVSSARVDWISPSGTIVSASATLTTPIASTTLQLDTPVLSTHLEQGTWTILGVLLVDAAGNSAQVASTLASLGYTTTLNVSNASSDAVVPQLSSLAILNPTLTPSTGTARMSFGITATDNASGVAKVRIDVRGPSNQLITVWGDYTATHPTSLTAQIDSPYLSVLLETGTWSIETLTLYDEAGNSTLLDTNDLSARGISTTLTVN